MFRIPVDLFNFPEQRCQRSQRNRGCCDKAMEDPMELFLRFHPLLGSAMFQSQPCRRQKQPEKWIKRLRLRGFEPNDINVTVEDDNVIVHAKHVDGEDGNTDSYESKRTFTVPDNVDTQHLSSHMNMHSVLVIQAPFLQEEKENEDQNQESTAEGAEKPEVKQAVEKASDNTTSDIINQIEDVIPQHIVIDREHEGENVKTSVKPIVTFPAKTESVSDDESEFETFSCDESRNELNLSDDIHNDGSLDAQLNVSDKGDSFKLNLNLERFPVENIQVIHKDKSLIVKAEQKKEEDGMKMTEYYLSEHSLPENVDTSELKCIKGSDGRLLVQAPYQEIEERELEIE